MRTKISALLAILSLIPFICDAEELSYAAKSFRSNIQNFLREEGFSPSIDNDGSLCFKKEGEAYWIDVIGDKPFYVTFHKAGLGTKDASEIAVLRAINEVNTDIRAIKCCYHNDGVAFSIESYCYVAEDFRYVFYDYLRILEASESAVKEAYSKYNTSSDNNSTISIKNPKCDINSSGWLELKEVLLTPTKTILKFHYTNKYDSAGWCNIDSGSYITANGNRYKLINAIGIPISPKMHQFSRKYQTLDFSLEFPAIPSSTSFINFTESAGSAWNITNIKLK